MTNIFQKIIALIFIALLTACDLPDNERPPLKIAISPWPGYSFALLAHELGYLESDKNNAVELLIYESLNESYTAYEKGNADGLFSTLIEIIESAHNNNNVPTVVLVTDFSRGSDKIIAKEAIKTIKQLKGKKVGSEDTYTSMYVLSRALEINDVKPEEIKLVPLNPDKIPAAFASSLIDAAVTYPPFTTQMNKYAPNTLFHSGMIENEIIDVLSIRHSVLRERSDTVKLFIEGWIKAYDFYKQNPDRANQLLKKYPAFTQQSTLNESLSGLNLPNYDDQSTLFRSGGTLDMSFDKIVEHRNKFSGLNYTLDKNQIFNR